MEPVERLIRIARQRIRLSRATDVACNAAIALSAMVLVLAVLDRMPATSFLSWWPISLFLLLLALFVSVLAWSLDRPSDLAVATLVDVRLELDDRLATAMHMQHRGDPIARAVVQDAVKTASDPRTGERVRRTFRPVTPPRWWVAPLLLVFATAVGFFGQADLFAASAPEELDTTLQTRVTADHEAVTSVIEAQPQLKEAMSDLLESLEAEQAEAADEARTPEQQQRDELKRMTQIERSLDELLTGEQGQEMDALRDSLQQLDQPAGADVEALSNALSEGDFKKASDALEAMRSSLDDPSMSQAQRDEMASQLEELGRKLEALAQDQDALAEALKQAGLDPALAENEEALTEALNQSTNLNEQQRQQLMELIKSQRAAQQSCQSMGEACNSMANQCQQGKPGQQCGQAMGRQLSALEQAQEMLKQAEAAQGACQSQCRKLGAGLPSNSQSQCANPGGGNMGMGGAGMQVAEDETDTTLEQAGGGAEQGPVIGQTKMDGPVRTGTSSKSFDEIVARSADGFDDAFNESQLPRKYHDLIKHYFGNAREVTDAVEYDAAQAEDEDETTESPAQDVGDSPPAEDDEPPVEDESPAAEDD